MAMMYLLTVGWAMRSSQWTSSVLTTLEMEKSTAVVTNTTGFQSALHLEPRTHFIHQSRFCCTQEQYIAEKGDVVKTEEVKISLKSQYEDVVINKRFRYEDEESSDLQMKVSQVN